MLALSWKNNPSYQTGIRHVLGQQEMPHLNELVKVEQEVLINLSCNQPLFTGLTYPPAVLLSSQPSFSFAVEAKAVS